MLQKSFQSGMAGQVHRWKLHSSGIGPTSTSPGLPQATPREVRGEIFSSAQ
jgi:hypothetical protein